MAYRFPLTLAVFGYNEQRRRPPMDAHKHDTVELYYVTKGNATLSVWDEQTGRQEKTELFSHQLALFRPGVPHAINSDADLQYYVLEIALASGNPDVVGYLSSLEYVQAFKQWEALVSDWKSLLVVNDTQNLEQIFNGFRALQKMTEEFRTAQLEILLKRLFLAVLQCETPERDTKGQNRHIRRAQSFILSNFNRSITPKDVAAHAGISLPYLQKLFRSGFGATITDKINEAKVRYAAQLLVLGGYAVGEIAALSGFGTTQHFQATFRRAYGMSPREYRKKHARKRHRENYVERAYPSPDELQ